jgi:hypothetical protein
MSKIDSNPIHTIGYIPSTRFLELVDWKIKNRKPKTSHLNVTINTSIIIDCAIYIEGFLNLFLIEYLNMNCENLEKNLTNYFVKKIESSQFNSIQELFMLLPNFKLSEITDDKTFKGVNHLFNLRNSIVHGNEINIQFFKINGKYEIKASGKFANVFEYLKEVGVHSKTVNETLDFDQFFSNETTDFFFTITKNFANDFYRNTEKFKLDLMNSYFEHYFKNFS